MPSKLPFKVVHVSGEDDGYNGKELEVHSPTTRGWQSNRFCPYPQEIVLGLADPSKINKIQILSHQYNVSSKIEILITLPNDGASFATSKFKRLGYVVMADNTETGHQARELKSVVLDAEGQYIKLLIHKNHVNKYNLYNQVGLVAVNVIGQSLLKKDENANSSLVTDELINMYETTANLNTDILQYAQRQEGGKYISPMDDLSFDMYQDPETAQLIRKLEEKKTQAVLEERFDYAKKLKQAMADLYKVGERLGRFEVEKRRAIECEDYDQAKTKKIQSDEYRLHVYKQLDIYDLMEIEKPTRVPVVEYNEIEIKHPPAPSEPVTLPPVVRTKSPAMATPPPDKTVKFPAVVAQDTVTARHPDDRPLPSLKGKPAPQQTEEETSPRNNILESEEPSGMTEIQENEARIIIDVFGLELAQQMYSKTFNSRQLAVQHAMAELSVPRLSEGKSEKDVLRACIVLLEKILCDQVFVVIQEGIFLLKALISSFIPMKKLAKSEVSFVIEKLFPIFMRRSGDTVARSREQMISTAAEVAKMEEVKGCTPVTSIICEPIKGRKQPPWRLLKGQIDIMHRLIKDTGINQPGGLAEKPVMNILLKGIEHQNNEVRDAVFQCVFQIYRTLGEPLKGYFPPDDMQTRKNNPIYTKLFDGFDAIDGKPTLAQRKAEASKKATETDQKKQAEVDALKAQLEALRNMAQQQQQPQPDAPGPSTEVEPDVPAVEKSPKKSKASKLPVAGTKKTKPEEKGEVADVERMCIFCGETNDNFTEEGLDVHYWKTCPMLKRCDQCQQVVEISALQEHMTSECDKADNFEKCSRCQEAVPKGNMETHNKTKRCIAMTNKDFMSICPLCKKSISDGDENWKNHLTKSCVQNRERMAIGKGLKTGGAAKTAAPNSKIPSKSKR